MRKRRRRIPGIRPRVFDSMHTWPLLGLDEVGTGGVAGPIAASGVVLPQDEGVLDALSSLGLKDSKEMTSVMRSRAYEVIRKHAVFCHTEFIHPRELEAFGQGPSLDKMFDCIMGKFRLQMGTGGSIVLDGNFRKNLSFFHVAVHQGDQKSFSIAAASVVAKVERDAVMVDLAQDFPGYGLEKNKGYLTRDHKEGLEKLGVAEVHRRNTKPIKAFIASPLD